MTDSKKDETKQDETLKRMLQAPPEPQKKVSGDLLASGDFNAVIDGRLRIAKPNFELDESGSITMNLYQNLRDFRRGVVMERAFSGRV